MSTAAREPERVTRTSEHLAAAVVFAVAAYLIVPFGFGGSQVATVPGRDLDAALATLVVADSVHKLFTSPATFYDTAILHPDRTQLRSTEPFLGFALLALPLKAVRLNDTDTYEVLRWILVVTALIYAYLLFRAHGVGLALSIAGAVLCWSHGELQFGIERLQILSIPLIVPAIYHAFMAARSPRPAPHAAGLFLWVALYPLCGAVNATIVALGAVLSAPWLVKALVELRVRQRLLWCVGPVVAAAAVDVAVLWPWLVDRADLAVYGLPEFLDVKHWNSIRVPGSLDLVPVYARSLIGPGMAAAIALLIVGAAVGTGASPASIRLGPIARVRYLVPVVLAAAASAAASLLGAGQTTAEWTRAIFHVVCWGTLVAFTVRQLRWSAARHGPLESAAMLSAGVGAFLCLMAFGPVYVSNPHGLANHVLSSLLHVIPPLQLVREYHRLWVFGGIAFAIYVTLRLDWRMRGLPRAYRAAAAVVLVAAALWPLTGRELTPSQSIEPADDLMEVASHSKARGAIYVHPEMHWNSGSGVFMIAAARQLGRPFVNGYLGISPPYFPYASSVLHSFPAEEALWLLHRWNVDTVVALDPKLQSLSSPFAPRVFDSARGVIWEISPRAGSLQHPTRGTPLQAAGSIEVPWRESGDIRRGSVVIEVPDGIRPSSIQVQFRPSVIEQMPSRIGVFAFDGAPGARLNRGMSGDWIHSLAADALLRRQSPVAVVDLVSTTANALLVEFEGTAKAPVERIVIHAP